MQITIQGKAKGTAVAPPSKSMAHRVVLAAALAEGTSYIENLEWSEDILATLQAVQAFGAVVEKGENWAKITGVSMPKPPKNPIDCGESGSTLRFLIPILAQAGTPITLVGHGRLLQRPQQVYQKLFEERDLPFEITKEGVAFCGSLQGGEYTLQGNISSQFITGLLFGLPLAEQDSFIRILPPLESRSYLHLTIQVLQQFGIQVEWKDAYTIFVAGKQKYCPRNIRVEADWSNGAFLAVLGAITSQVQVEGLSPDSKQGDAVIFDILQRCGVKISTIKEQIVEFSATDLAATEIDLADCPDLGPILMVLATFCKGKTRIKNAGRLRIKESDRIDAMAQELAKFGAIVQQLDKETIEIQGTVLQQPSSPICSHGDHRVVMSCSVAALAAGLKITIQDAQAVNKSWPNFFDVLSHLGVDLQFTL